MDFHLFENGSAWCSHKGGAQRGRAGRAPTPPRSLLPSLGPVPVLMPAQPFPERWAALCHYFKTILKVNVSSFILAFPWHSLFLSFPFLYLMDFSPVCLELRLCGSGGPEHFSQVWGRCLIVWLQAQLSTWCSSVSLSPTSAEKHEYKHAKSTKSTVQNTNAERCWCDISVRKVDIEWHLALISTPLGLFSSVKSWVLPSGLPSVPSPLVPAHTYTHGTPRQTPAHTHPPPVSWCT